MKAIKKLEKHASVISAEPDYLVAPEEDLSVDTDDSGFTYDDTIDAAPELTPHDTYWGSQYALTKLNTPAAWGMTTGSRSVKVGIIDSGIASHPDLNANLVAGWDFYHNNSITNDVSNYPHGTHVAGIIGAVGNNAAGISGINWNVSLVPLQVVITDGTSNDGFFSGSAIIAAMDYARTNDISIVNCSFGSLRSYFAYETAMRNYSGLIVCSAGNGKDHDNNPNTPNIPVNTDLEPHDPSCTPLDNVLSVASTDKNDALASTSNYGATSVDLAAPGVSIYSTLPSGSYGYMSGTSMAAPQVAGVAALIKAYNSYMDAIQIKQIILNSVDPIGALIGKCVSGGRLNANKALLATKDLPAAIEYQTVAGDFNGDGKDDLAYLIQSTNSTMEIHVKLSNGHKYGNTLLWSVNNQYQTSQIKNRVIAGDFNGDGKDDIACMYDYGNSRMKTFVWPSSGTKFIDGGAWLESMTTGSFDCWRLTGRLVAGDFNGDGKDDIGGMYEYPQNNMRIPVWLSNGSRLNGWYIWVDSMTPGSYEAPRSTGRFVAGDINGDGKTDIAAIHAYPNGMREPHIYLSPGEFS